MGKRKSLQTTWTSKGRKQIVRRCISRLEHSKKYCSDSPTFHEEKLHRAIINAINDYFDCHDKVKKILKTNLETAILNTGHDEISRLEQRLAEIDQARNDLVGLIASGGCDESTLDDEFSRLYSEEKTISEKLLNLKTDNQNLQENEDKIDEISSIIDSQNFKVIEFDNVLVRKLIECIKVISKTEIMVIFKGGFEVREEVEK